MSPLSIGCFILDFILGSKQGEGYFDRLMHIGRRSDRLINLFEQHEDERISSEEKVAEQ
ncbi:MAG: hypothetical protein R3332_03525 [Pseudohongiellaceae bacterium]|nr:hypothetical protein [Pseudohongiellaceae bacterium]